MSIRPERLDAAPASRLLVLTTLVALCALLTAREAAAVPSFARQTGLTCSICHVQAYGPYLTPYGRMFKLHGYVDGTANNPVPLVAGMLLGSFSHVDKAQPEGTQEPGTGTQDNFAFDQASLFLAGRVLSHLGMFSQLTYDGVAKTLALDNTEVRSNFETLVLGQELDFGVSFNNSPTMEDLWHTTPTWGFPATGSPVAPTPTAAALIDGGLAGQVGGGLAYAQFAHVLYAAAGAYATFDKGMQRTLGTFAADEDEIDGAAPYWRVAAQWQTAKQYFQIGHYGLQANVLPGRVTGSGHDEVTDLAIDTTYQYLGDTYRHVLELRSAYIWEERHNRAGFPLGNVANPTNRLDTFRVNATYTFLQTYGLAAGYSNVWGTFDPVMFAPDPVGGSRTGRPDSEAVTLEMSYAPFGKAQGGYGSAANVRFALQYVAYLSFNGASHDYDGFGRNASDNDTLMLNAWLSF